MPRSKGTINISALVAQTTLGAEDKTKVVQKIADWRLSALEEFLLTNLILPNPAVLLENLASYDDLLSLFRSSDRPFWASKKDMPAQVDKALLESDQFLDDLVYSMYRWLGADYHEAAIHCLTLFENFTNSGFGFGELSEAWQMPYRRLAAIIFVEYFEFSPLRQNMLFMNGLMVVLAEDMNLNVLDALKASVTDFVDLEVRTDIALREAAFLATNLTPLGGPDAAGQERTVKYWIDKYLLWDNKSALNDSTIQLFMQSDALRGVNQFEAKTIQKIITDYCKLCNMDFIIPPETRPEIIKKYQEKLKKSAKQQKIIFALSNDQDKIKLWLEGQANAPQAREIIRGNLSKIKWFEEPNFPQVLQLDELFQARFSNVEPLIFFDEQTQKFMLS